MSNETQQILNQALKMPPQERATLAEQLIESLDETTNKEFDPEVELALQKVIAKRIDDIDSGKVKLVPWEDVQKQLRERLNAPH